MKTALQVTVLHVSLMSRLLADFLEIMSFLHFPDFDI